MERFLAIATSLLLGACFVSGWFALRSFAGADDLRGLFLGAVCLASGFSAQRILDPNREGE